MERPMGGVLSEKIDIQSDDVAAAFGLLTRLPVPVDTDTAMKRGAHVVWAFPIVGLAVGAAVALTLWGTTLLGLSAVMAGCVAVAVGLFVTGAMHEDGLADCLDGFWGGWDTSRRLEIMKDSTIGVYGMAGLALVLVARAVGLGDLQSLWAILGLAAFSRSFPALAMALMPNARDGGLSAGVGVPPVANAMVAFGIGGIVMILLGGLGPALVMCIAAGGVALLATRKIGGQTGDVLGAMQQVSELAGLMTLIAIAA